MGNKTQVVHQGQHPYRHKAQEILYARLGIQKNVKIALDELYNMSGGTLYWKDPAATPANLPLTGNAVNEARIVQDDGDGNPALYVCIATVGDLAAQWLKLADVDWGNIFDGTVLDGDLVKRLGTVLTKVTGISELLIVAAHALATFTHDAGIKEVGETLNSFNLNWTYNRNGDNPTSQTITQGIGAVTVAARTYAVAGAGLTSTTVYGISAVGDDTNPTSLNASVYFRQKRYWGISENILTTGADVMSVLQPQDEEFGTSRAVTKTFDASAGSPPNYLYFAYPQSWGSPASTKFGGFTYSDYTESVVSVTNASGYTSNYILLRTNPSYNGAGLEWQIL